MVLLETSLDATAANCFRGCLITFTGDFVLFPERNFSLVVFKCALGVINRAH